MVQKSATLGFALLLVVFIYFIASVGLIPSLKENLDNNRGGTTLNCPGTSDFNQTAYDEQDSFERLGRRSTCFVTGITMFYFIGAFLLASVVWLVRNWIKLGRGTT